jgi:4-hydroxybenzoate polyprenyltransferase
VTRLLSDGLALIKFRYHITFITVVFGALIFAEHLDFRLLWRLVALYMSFNVLLYSGLYTLNDQADHDSDSQHAVKRHRPIASGRISNRAAAWWMAGFLVSGLISGTYIFGAPIVWCYAAVIVINLAYSCGGREVVFVDAVLNGLPHVVRFVMGAVLVSRWPPATHILSLTLLATAFSALRRRVERDVPGWHARRVLRDWSPAALDRVIVGSLIGLVVVASWQWCAAPGFYAAALGTATLLIGGAYSSTSIRESLRWFWTR